jgi:pimeloyl-ACP methyl ester carboxylesterase
VAGRDRRIGWAQGTDLAYLKELIEYWRDEFDWRVHEGKLNELPHYHATVDRLDIHFVHARGRGPNPYPLIITHGWPSTFFEISKLIPLLADPAAYGADERDAFDVVVPSMPGYGFSERLSQQGVPPRVPELWVELMTLLAYTASAPTAATSAAE